MPYTEANYENAVIELFRDTLGYSCVYGPDASRGYADPLCTGEFFSEQPSIIPLRGGVARSAGVVKCVT